MFFGKLKKLIVVLGITMIATAMCSGIFTAQAKVVYSDVPDDYLYKNAIYSLLYDGVMEGKKQPDNTYIFRPNSTVTKADAAMFIVNAIVKNDAEFLETSNKYSDVPVDHPANKYITYATQTGIVWDNGDGKFLPDVAITYGEMVKMLVLASDAGSRCKKTTPWYDGYINVATELGISRQRYSNYELGKREPEYRILVQLSRFFGVTVIRWTVAYFLNSSSHFPP